MITASHVKEWLTRAVAEHPDDGLSIVPGIQDEVFWPRRGPAVHLGRRDVIILSTLPGKKPRLVFVSINPHATPDTLPAIFDDAVRLMLELPVKDDDGKYSMDQFEKDFRSNPSVGVEEVAVS